MDQPQESHELVDFSVAASRMQRPIGHLITLEQFRQAKFAFRAALAIGALGTVLLFGAFGLFAYRGFAAGAGIGVGAGIVMQILGLFWFKLYEQTCTRLDSIRRDASIIALLPTIENREKRDEAIYELLKMLAKKPP